MPHLVAENGPLAGERLEVKANFTIGRADADLVIADPKLSRRHAVFRVVAQALEVEDLGSKNGTFVEGRRIDGVTQLDNGARVRLGDSSFVVELEAALERTLLDQPIVGEPAPEALETVARVAATAPETTAREAPTAPEPRVRSAPEPALPPAPEPALRGMPTPGAVTLQDAGAFAPPHARRGGLATRSWVPVALSYGTVFVVAVALVIYFAAR